MTKPSYLLVSELIQMSGLSRGQVHRFLESQGVALRKAGGRNYVCLVELARKCPSFLKSTLVILLVFRTWSRRCSPGSSR